MKRDANNPMLFEDHKELSDVAWECAYRILAVGRRSKVPREDIEALSEDLLRWCQPCELNGEHWTAEQQMRWLAQYVRDKCSSFPSAKELRQMRLAKFGPAPPMGDTIEALKYKYGEWAAGAKCKLCGDSGKLFPKARKHLRISDDSDDSCTCAEGERRREEVKREAEAVNQQPASRPFGYPESLRFDEDLRVHRLGRERPKRSAEPTKRDWADTTPTHVRLKSIFNKDPKDWSAKDLAFLRRLDKP